MAAAHHAGVAAVSGLFGSSVIKGTRITDFSQTTATVGVPIPFGYGRFTSGGNVIWAPLPPKEHRSVQRQGKGGVKQETFTYTLSYAVAFAKGPIAGYWWIKRNGKVVWTQDPAAPIEDREYAAKWQQRATFYNGTMTQLPDSTIESYEGSGQVSAFHRLAYIVVEDDDVTEGGGAVPTYEACVIADGMSYATSPPYPVEAVDEVGHSSAAVAGAIIPALKPVDDVVFASVALGGAVKKVVQRYVQPANAVHFSSIALGGNVYARLVQYTEPPEAVHFSSIALGGNTYARLIDYADDNAVHFTSIALGGSLT